MNIKDRYGRTAFHTACSRGHVRIVDIMIEQSESLELDFKAKDKFGETGYQSARENRQIDVVNLIQTRMPSLAV